MEPEIEEVRKKLGKRILWTIVWTVFVRPFPRCMASKWEIFLLRLFGAKIGKGCQIYSSASIWLPEHLIIEDDVQIADHVIIQNSKPLYLKRGCMISQYTYICDGNHYVENMVNAYTKSITLEEDCWIGAQCYIGCGVTIGRGCMIGARAVVMINPPAYSIVSGNPSKVVGFRFTPEEIIEKEKKEFEEAKRLDYDILEKNYSKYFINRIQDIKKWTRL